MSMRRWRTSNARQRWRHIGRPRGDLDEFIRAIMDEVHRLNEEARWRPARRGLAAALVIILFVAVASEILMENIRGGIAAVFGGVFESPFLAKTTTFEGVLSSVGGLLPEDNEDAILLMARLKEAEAEARAISSDKAVADLAREASQAADTLGLGTARKIMSGALPTIVAGIDVQDRRHAVFIKLFAAVLGVSPCQMADIDAFSLRTASDRAAGAVEGQTLASGFVEIGWGVLLTGIAAAGGSTLRHAQIERVRGIRNTVQAARDVVSLPRKAEITLARIGRAQGGGD